jgi:ribosomal protein S18 acetylase RimI-like enzyme
MAPVNDTVEVREVASEHVTESLVRQAHELFGELVKEGAALGWVSPPGVDEVSLLLGRVAAGVVAGEASLVVARRGEELLGLGYWTRYERETRRPHVDIGRIAVVNRAQGQHLGRRITTCLIDTARSSATEVITLDLRSDNVRAKALYESLGFVRYGELPHFIAAGDERFANEFYYLRLHD